MKIKKVDLKAPAKLKKLIKRLQALQSELQKIVKDKALLKEVRRLRGIVEKEARKHLTSEIERVKAFLNLARGELESLQKQYVAPGKRTMQKRVKKAFGKKSRSKPNA